MKLIHVSLTVFLALCAGFTFFGAHSAKQLLTMKLPIGTTRVPVAVLSFEKAYRQYQTAIESKGWTREDVRDLDKLEKLCDEEVPYACAEAGVKLFVLAPHQVDGQDRDRHYQNAIRYLSTACSWGLTSSCRQLHQWGRDSERTFAVSSLRELCRIDGRSGCSDLGEVLIDSASTLHEGRDYLREACESDNASACGSLGRNLLADEGERDHAIKFLDKSCRAGDAYSCLDLFHGLVNERQPRRETASLDTVKARCESGEDNDACLDLAQAYAELEAAQPVELTSRINEAYAFNNLVKACGEDARDSGNKSLKSLCSAMSSALRADGFMWNLVEAAIAARQTSEGNAGWVKSTVLRTPASSEELDPDFSDEL
jgi:hypothetical protein